MSAKKFIPLIILLIIAFVGGAIYYMRQERPDTLTLYGNVDIREVQLSFRVSGKLAEMNVEEGTKVSAGMKIAALDNAPYHDKLLAATAQADSLSANLDKLVAGARQSEIDQARALLNVRQADLKNTEQQLERVKKLRNDGTVSQAQLDSATAQHDMAKANVAATAASLALLEEGSRKEDIAAGYASLAAARAEQSSAETAYNDAVLHAPSNGVIRNRLREPGAIISAGEPVYVLALQEPLRVRGYIGETDLGHIHPGQRLAVRSDTNPNKLYYGVVGFISPTAEFTPKTVETPQLRADLVYRFWLTLDPEETGLLQGMPVSIIVPMGAKHD